MTKYAGNKLFSLMFVPSLISTSLAKFKNVWCIWWIFQKYWSELLIFNVSLIYNNSICWSFKQGPNLKFQDKQKESLQPSQSLPGAMPPRTTATSVPQLQPAVATKLGTPPSSRHTSARNDDDDSDDGSKMVICEEGINLLQEFIRII